MKTLATMALLGIACASPALAGERARPLDLTAASLASLPCETVEASAHGQALHCEGVPLAALLRAAGALPDKGLHGKALTHTIHADARDGYQVVFSLAELDPTLGGREVFVVDRCDGNPLDAKTGPLRLVVPGDSRPARWLRQLQSITVEDTR